jgi:NTE family protein
LPVRSVDVKNDLTRPVGFYDRFQTDQQAAKVLQHPTDLMALSGSGFDALARHGFEIADATLTTYVAADFPTSHYWGSDT